MAMRRSRVGVWLAISAALALVASARASVIDGSFESGGLANWTVTGSAVQVSSTQGRTDGLNAVAWNSGNLVGTSSIAQTFATVPGQRYLLEFDYGVYFAQSSGTRTQQLIATVQGLSALLNKTISGTGPGTVNNDTTFTRYYLPFVADSGSATLTFTDNTSVANSASADGNLDNVVVAAAGPGVVSPGGIGTVGTVRFQSGNVALATAGGVATQINDYAGPPAAVAGRAIDGNTNGYWSASSTTHTATGGPGVWWQVALSGEYAIQNVTLFNRSDACQDRLVEFTVNLLNGATGVNVLNPFDLGNPNGANTNLDGVADNGANSAQAYPQYGLCVSFAPNTIGQTVRVEQLAVGCVLSLAEVQAWGLASYIQPAGDILNIDIASAASFDFVSVASQALLDGLLAVSLLPGNDLDPQQTIDVLMAQSLTLGPNFALGGAAGDFFTYRVLTDPQSGFQMLELEYNYVPEPGALALLALGGMGLLRRRRRARRARGLPCCE